LFQWDYRQEYFDAVDGYLTARRNGDAASCALFFDDMKNARRAAHEAVFREQMEEIWLLLRSSGAVMCSSIGMKK
jgi:hypothetical protein